MRDHIYLVVFRLDEHRYALRLDAVERIIRAVELTPLPNAPAIVLGVMDVAGRVLPVLNLRQRFRLPDREIDPVDQFLIARTASRTVALVVDEVQEVITYLETAVIDADQIVPGLEYIHGVITLEDGLVLIQDLEQCLSLDEERDLANAMNNSANLEAAHGV
jgi:purine-binding chemotaxis protein CheW